VWGEKEDEEEEEEEEEKLGFRPRINNFLWVLSKPFSCDMSTTAPASSREVELCG
jgi:hypothetical protein